MLFRTPQLMPEELRVVDVTAEMRSQLRLRSIKPLRWYGMLRRNTLAQAIRGSNSIEGYNVTKEDAIAAVEGAEPLEAANESWLAVVGYRNAMIYVLQLTQDAKFLFSEGYIRSLHFMMLHYDLAKHPGNWRPGPIYVRNDQTNEVVYEAPDRSLVQPLIDELMQELNEPSEDALVPDVVKAAMAHLNFAMIHPFSDGNGRMARCLQTMVLSRQGILEPQFCSVEEYLGRYTQAYYEVLSTVGGGSWSPQNDARPWIRFMLKAHYQQAALLLWRMKLIQRLWDEIEILVKKLNLTERLIPALADAATGLRVRSAIYRKQVDISENLASRDMKLAVDGKLLVAKGEGRGRYYESSSELKALHDKVYEPFKTIDPFDFGGGSLSLPGIEP